MTYAKIAHRRYARRPARRGMSGFLDDVLAGAGIAPLLPPSETSACLDQANAAVAPLDAQIDDLVKTWEPTGFYTPQDLRGFVTATMAVLRQGQAALDQAASEPQASQESILRATDDLARMGARSLDYLQAATTADQQGIRVVNAPGFKRWITDALASASSAVVTASVIGCLRPWWAGALTAFQRAFDALYAVAKQFVGAVVAIGETALKVVGDLPEIYDLLKYALVGGGIYWLWLHLTSSPKP